MAKPLIWSPLPRESYTITVEGKLYGIGIHPAFAFSPGAWNIYWLSTNTPDQCLEWGDPAEGFPSTSALLPLAVGMSWQNLTDYQTIGSLAEAVPPTEFLHRIQGDATLILPALVGDAWWEVAQERAKLYRPFGDNVTRVDFRNK